MGEVDEWGDELYWRGTAAARAAEAAHWAALLESGGGDDVPEEEEEDNGWNSRLDTITTMVGWDFRAAVACEDEDHDEDHDGDPAAPAAPTDDARA